MNETAERNPAHVWIEPTSRCNTRCRHCQHFHSVFGEDMSAALYDKIRAAVLDDVRCAELIGYGEPLVAPLFDRMFDDCASRGIAIRMTTNGLALTDGPRLDKLVRAGLALNLSIDGARPETFEFVRPYVKWTRMVEILKSVRRAADAAGADKRFRFGFNFVPMKANIADLPALTALAAAFGAEEVCILPLAGDFGAEEMKDQSLHDSPELVSPAFLEALKLGAQTGVRIAVPPAFRELILEGAERGRGLKGKWARLRRGAILARQYLSRHGLKNMLARPSVRKKLAAQARLNFCFLPWNDAYFAADGQVFPCCGLGDALGDMTRQEWRNIWNGPAYRNLRRTIHSWNPTETCRHCGLPMGINGGDGRRYEKFFARFRAEEIPLDSPALEFGEGFHPLERDAHGAPTHRWMSRAGELRLAPPPGARFIRFDIFAREPLKQIASGTCHIEGAAPEPFDTSCEQITFPIPRATARPLHIGLEMETDRLIPPDIRRIALGICGISLLFPGARNRLQ